MTTTTIEQFREQCKKDVENSLRFAFHHHYTNTKIIEICKDSIAALPLPVMPSQAEPVEWIKCSDRMPEEGVAVILIWLGAVQHVTYFQVDGQWCYVESEDKVEDDDCGKFLPSHWMPLPELPKG